MRLNYCCCWWLSLLLQLRIPLWSMVHFQIEKSLAPPTLRLFRSNHLHPRRWQECRRMIDVQIGKTPAPPTLTAFRSFPLWKSTHERFSNRKCAPWAIHGSLLLSKSTNDRIYLDKRRGIILETLSETCMLRAGRPGPLRSGHWPWPGNFSIRHILTHSRTSDWLY